MTDRAHVTERSNMIRNRFGVRERLLLAFFGISAFAVLAAAAAMYSFLEVGKSLKRITQDRVPATVASQQLSRQAERIAAAAPTLLTVSSGEAHGQMSERISAELDRLEALLTALRVRDVDPESLILIEDLVARLTINLVTIDTMIINNIVLVERRTELLRDLRFTVISTRRRLAPGILLMDAKLAELREALAVGDSFTEGRSREIAGLAAPITYLAPQARAQAEVSAINDMLIKIAAAPSQADLEVLVFPLRRSLDALTKLLPSVEPALAARLGTRMTEFRGYVEGANSIVDARARELRHIASMQTLLDQNVDVSNQLTRAVDRLVANANRDIQNANLDALSVQRTSTVIMVTVVVLSLVCSALIVWLYVGRNLTARLTGLSNSMLAIAGGNLQASIPTGGADEISKMAVALNVFRDTAIEVKESNLREIREARRRLSDAIESIAEGFSLYDADDCLVLCNSHFREDLYPGIDDVLVPGTPFEAILKRAVELGLIKDAQNRDDEWVAARLAMHHDPTGPHLQQQSDGRWIQIDERKTEDGGTVAVYSDITELKTREHELADLVEALKVARDQALQGTRAKSAFLANMSHELRTPMNAIMGYTELIVDGIYGDVPDKVLGVVRRIDQNSHHLLDLINDVLDLSKIEAGQYKLSLREYSLEQVIQSAISAIEPLAVEKHLYLRVAADPSLPAGVGDEKRLTEVLVNIIGNAVKFTEDGEISITASRRNSQFEVSITDTGIGIPAREKEHIFESFHQVDNSATKEKGGTGLGLAIAKHLVELHGGTIWVESRLGQGSTFVFRIPIRAEC